MRLFLLSLPLLLLSMTACDRNPTGDTAKERAKDATDYEANKLKVKGNWHEAKGKLKQKYADLTDDDLLYVEGKEEELYGKLQKRLGKTRQEVEKILEDL